MTAGITPDFYLPSVDIGPYLEDPSSLGGQTVLEQIRSACRSTGFFQLTGHGIDPTIQRGLFQAARSFFALPIDAKLPLDVRKNIGFRGYDVMASQSYEPGVLGDLKEGYIVGTDVPLDDPRVVQRRFFMGRNVWPPAELLSDAAFREPVERYYDAVLQLCWTVFDIIVATLPCNPSVLDEFKQNDAACPLRLLHYPPTPESNDNDEKRQLGSSAHTDFGAITLLLQDEQPGLEVQNAATGEWIGVPPNKDAYVVNIGDMMSMMTGNQYKSSVHRVVNKTGTERYSVAFFIDGNLDFKLRRLDGTGDDQIALTVEEHMEERRRASYGLPKS